MLICFRPNRSQPEFPPVLAENDLVPDLLAWLLLKDEPPRLKRVLNPAIFDNSVNYLDRSWLHETSIQDDSARIRQRIMPRKLRTDEVHYAIRSHHSENSTPRIDAKTIKSRRQSRSRPTTGFY